MACSFPAEHSAFIVAVVTKGRGYVSIAAFHNLFLPTAHPTLTMAHEGTPQNLALRKGVTKQYVTTKNADPICKAVKFY
jgi:hypothetical protein